MLALSSQCWEIVGNIGDSTEEIETITKFVSSRPRVTETGLVHGGLSGEYITQDLMVRGSARSVALPPRTIQIGNR